MCHMCDFEHAFMEDVLPFEHFTSSWEHPWGFFDSSTLVSCIFYVLWPYL
jgi:hypothetical protein